MGLSRAILVTAVTVATGFMFFGCSGAKAPKRATINSVGMSMVPVCDDLWVAVHETTQEQFARIMGYNPCWPRGDKLPVASVTREEGLEFCARLTETQGASEQLPTGFVYTLPGLGDWKRYVEDAPQDGSVTPAGWRRGELRAAMPVGSGERNSLGLYDLRGNVAELSRDMYSQNPARAIVLGASWNTHRLENMSVTRKKGIEGCSLDVGFRCVMVPVSSGVLSTTGDSPLHKAAAAGEEERVRALAQQVGPVGVNAANLWSDRPIHRASLYGHSAAVIALIEAGAGADLAGKRGWRALHYSCMQGEGSTVEALLKRGADPAATDDRGMTPLHIAAWEGYAQHVRLLLSHGSPVEAKPARIPGAP